MKSCHFVIFFDHSTFILLNFMIDIEQQPLLHKTARQHNRKCYRILGAIFGFLIVIGGLVAAYFANSDRNLAIGASAIPLGGGILIYSLFYTRHHNGLLWQFLTLFVVLLFSFLISSSNGKAYCA